MKTKKELKQSKTTTEIMMFVYGVGGILLAGFGIAKDELTTLLLAGLLMVACMNSMTDYNMLRHIEHRHINELQDE